MPIGISTTIDIKVTQVAMVIMVGEFFLQVKRNYRILQSWRNSQEKPANLKKVVAIIHIIAGTNEFSTCKTAASVT